VVVQRVHASLELLSFPCERDISLWFSLFLSVGLSQAQLRFDYLVQIESEQRALTAACEKRGNKVMF
jgi:hypothetical protein